jgi:hypothetical protein
MSTAIQSTTTSRRSLLTALAAASVVAVPAIVSPCRAAATIAEDPALLALGRELDALATAYAEKRQLKDEAKARFHALCPIPDELVVSEHECGRPEVDWDHEPIRDQEGGRRFVLSVSGLELDAIDYGPRTKRGKLARAKLKIAREYEAAKERAEEATDIRAVHEALSAVEKSLNKIAGPIMKTPARTLAGLEIKARLLLLYATKPEADGLGFSWLWFKYPNQIAKESVALSAARA